MSASLGALTPAVSRRIGELRTVTVALVVMTVGLAGRALAGSAAVFLLLSVLALAGGAMGNVVMPALVKRQFPHRIGPLTAAYTTAMAAGSTAAAGLAVPLSRLRAGAHGQDWRLGIGAWAALSAVAVLPWLAVLREDRRTATADAAPTTRLPVWRSRLAWSFAVFFGAQSLQAYVAFGWFAQLFRDAGVSAGRAGLLLALLAALGVPVSLVLPSRAARARDQRPLVAVLTACYAVAYTGMLLAPRAGALLWVTLVGLGSAAFPLVLVLITLRTRTPAATEALSAFAQSVGYLIAGTGPLLVGVLYGATGGWTAPLALLFVALACMLGSGWYVGRERFLEDDLAG